MDAALTTVLKTTPPADVNKVLKGLQGLVVGGGQQKDDLDALMRRVQLPFEVYDKDVEDPEKPFLLTRMNRIHGDIYRSPWTQKLYPTELASSVKAPGLSAEEKQIRLMESRANEIWDAYRVLYYGPEATGSVYLQQMKKKIEKKNRSSSATDGSFKGIFGIRKDCAQSGSSWNSIHVIHVEDPKGAPDLKCTYHVESTVLVVILPKEATIKGNSETDISASISKSTSRSLKVTKGMIEINHLENLGTIIEDVEIDIRSNLELIHIPRTKQLVDMIQSDDDAMHTRKPTKPNLVAQLMKDSKAWKKKHAEVVAAEEKE